MFTLGQLLIFSLAVPSYARPVDAPSSDETIPILLLPPSVGKHPTPPSRPSVIPLFHSDSDPGSVPSPGLAEQGSTSTLIDVKPTTLTVKVAPTQTIHIAQTRVITVTITVQATPTSTADEGKETAKPNAEPGPDTPIMATYFPDWTGEEFPPEKVDFSRFAWIDFAFAVPDENQQLTFTSDDSENLLHRLVRAAHAHGSKVKLSVGGWTGSRHFSDAVSNNANRHQFVKNIVSAYEKFNIDGIDLDWEYPGVQGASENKVTPADSAHFLLFLQLLRANLPDAAKITAATQVTPFAGPDGRPMNDVSAFAKVFDWILIMNYDIWGASPTPGPNAPLRDECHNSTQPDASASSSIAAWTNAGFAPKQLTLGLPSYGYVQTSSAQRLIQRRHNAFQRGAGARFAKLRVRQEEDDEDDSMDATAVGGSVRIKGEGTGDDSGQVQFKQLVKEGALKLSSSGSYVGSGGFNRMWDVCSSTPYLVSKNTKQLVAYDDPQSLGMKAAYARGAGILGVNMFDVHGDTEDWTLTDAIREGLGL